nr:hypothetical protein [Solirubrobacterales bacterium]
ILGLVGRLDTGAGRARVVEVLRGGRGRALVADGHDGLPDYGSFAELPAEAVVGAIDRLVADGRLVAGTGAADQHFGALRLGSGRTSRELAA